MPALRNEIDSYLQEMLKLQYKVSAGITHNPTKGTLREDFIKRIIIDEFPKLHICDGILSQHDWQSTQADFLLLNGDARIGKLKIYDFTDCKFFMEIKSRASAAELMAINNTAREIKQRCQDNQRITVGMFCYSTTAKEDTVVKKFGFNYDKEIDGYSSYDKALDTMNNVDFLLSLNICDESDHVPYLISRSISGECILYRDNLGTPVIQYFFGYFR